MSSLEEEMRLCISALGGERAWFETRQRWLERAARRAGITYRTARALFYGEVADPKVSVVERVRAAAARLSREQEASARETHAELLERIARLEARLAEFDAPLGGGQMPRRG